MQMPEIPIAAQDALADFDRRNAPRGRMIRYARSRRITFPLRQGIAAFGGLAVGLVVDPLTGLACCAPFMLVETAENLTLRRAERRVLAGTPAETLVWPTVVLGVLHSLASVFGIFVILLSVTPGAGTLYAIGVLAGLYFNAGIDMHLNRPANLARSAVLGLGILAMFGMELRRAGDNLSPVLLDIGGAMMMVYWGHSMVRSSVQAVRRQVESRRESLLSQVGLEQANRNLTAQQEELRLLSLVARHTQDVVIVTGEGQRIVWVNTAFEEFFGLSRAEVVGRFPREINRSPDTDPEVLRAIREAALAGRPHRTPLLVRNGAGEDRWTDFQLVPILDATGEMVNAISVQRDITEAREASHQLLEAKQAAEASERAKAEFLATMSHEIRTPMNAVIGMADLLSETEMGAEQRLYADTIRKSADSLLKIINDILDFSKLDAGKLTIDPQPFSLRACVTDAMGLLRAQAAQKRLHFDLDLAGPLPPLLLGDSLRIRQILVNLVGNAIKFTEVGGVAVAVRQAARGDSHLVTIDVRDTGVGIAPDRLDHIFEKFSQAEATTTRRFGGTGLGLTISRLLARRMNGDITVTSTPGAGSCFSVTLDLPAARDRPQPAEASPPRDPADLAGLSVLVAEDNRTNRLLIEKYLKDLPIALSFAIDGREAVAETARLAPDLVFMDMAMPEMDGLEATRRIRAAPDGPQPRIVALTANAFAADRAACLEAGMDDFLVKPVRRADLLDRLHRAAEGRNTTALPRRSAS